MWHRNTTVAETFRRTPWTWCIALAGGVCCLAGCTEPAPPPPPPPPPMPAEPVAPPKPVFTQDRYDKLLYGMTYLQAVEVLGAEATRQDSTYDEGESEFVRPSVTAWYYWENDDGSFIKLGFVEKKLVEMVAEDLPA